MPYRIYRLAPDRRYVASVENVDVAKGFCNDLMRHDQQARFVEIWDGDTDTPIWSLERTDTNRIIEHVNEDSVSGI